MGGGDNWRLNDMDGKLEMIQMITIRCRLKKSVGPATRNMVKFLFVNRKANGLPCGIYTWQKGWIYFNVLFGYGKKVIKK